MKTKLKKLVRSAKCLVLSAALCAVGLSAWAEPQKIDGSDVTWELTEDDIVLTIAGTGAMPDFESHGAPWYDQRTSIQTLEIKSGVTHLGAYAFEIGSGLKSVTIPASVTSIGEKAFWSSNGVAELHIDSIESWCKISLADLNSAPFCYQDQKTKELYVGGTLTTDLVIPDGVETVNQYTFRGWGMVTSVTIPSSVTSIGIKAFEKCSSLQSVIAMRETPPTAGSSFLDKAATFTVKGAIYVPPTSVDAYKGANIWKNYESVIFGAYLVSGVAEHGSLSFDKVCFPVESYKEPSETVTVTATPDKGYLFKSLVWNDGTDHDITETKSFTLPLACVTGTAVFGAEQPEPPPEPEGVSAESEAFAFDVREEIALAEGEVTIAGVSYSDTAWGAAARANVTLGWTNVETGATGVLAEDLVGAGTTDVTLPKKDSDYRLTHSTGDLTSFVMFTVSGYPLGCETNPWEIGAGEDPASVTAVSNGLGQVSFKPVRGTVTKAGLETITSAMGRADFPAKLIAADGGETYDLAMVLGASGTAYGTIAEALAADEASYTLFEAAGYFVSYSGGEGALGTMATDTFIPTVPTNLTANAYWIVGYDFTGWSKDGATVAYTNRQEGVDFAKPGETLALTALWEHVGVEPTDYNDLADKLPQVTRPVRFDLVRDIEIPAGGKIVVPAGKSVTFDGTGKFDVTAERPALFNGITVGTGLKPEDLDRFVTDKDVKAYFEDGKVIVRGRGETEEFPWLIGTDGHEDEVTAWAGDGMILTKPTRGTASVAALQSVTNALGGYVPGLGELKVISADGTATNNVVMLLGSDGVPYDTLADVFVADPRPETVRLFEVKGANVEFNAMGGVHANGREIVTNFCVVSYTLPEVKRDGYTFDGWYDNWKPGATKVEDGQDLLSFEPHSLYAQWTADNPTPTKGELDIPDVKDGVPVTSIDAKQYVNNASLKNVTTPLYLQSIGERAFMGCTSLEKLTITAARSYDDLSPVSVTVGQNAFSGCSSLDTVYIAAEIDNLGQSAFQNCANLKKIVFLGDGKITYGASAFYRCGYENGTGSLKVYMSKAFQNANEKGLIADLKRWNTQLKIIEKVDVAPVEGGSISISELNAENLAANDRRLAILVKTSVQGTPDPDDVDVEYKAMLDGVWSPLRDGTEKTANPDGTVLIEVTVPGGQSGFFRAVVK